MDFKERFNKELKEYNEKKRREKETELREQEEKMRKARDEQQRFHANVDAIHTLLKPIFDEFIRTTKFKVRNNAPEVAEYARTAGHRYYYHVMCKESTDVYHPLDIFRLFPTTYWLRVVDLRFGADGKLLIVEDGGVFTESDLSNPTKLKERFTDILIDVGKRYKSND